MAAAWRYVASLQRWQPLLVGSLLLIIGVLFFKALHGLLAELSYDAVVAAVRDTTPERIAYSLLATAVSYLALTGFDFSALRYVRASVPYWLVAQTAFIAYALTNSVGLGVLTGGAVRLRLYSAAGVEAGLITRVIAFNAAAFGTGLAVVGAFALLLGADGVAPAVHLPAEALRTGAAAVLAASGVLLWLCYRGPQYQLFGRYALRLPTASLALQQLFFSAVDIVASAAVLWTLLPASTVPFPAFVGLYAIATVLGVLSHLPGGIGVFEAVILVVLGGRLPADQLAGALVLYRIVYYALPLGLAAALLVPHELRRGTVAPITKAAASLAPILLAAFTLGVGVMLLASGATPATDEATYLLALHVPLSVVEAAHFLGSVAGVAFLFVARGMLQRLDAAWWAGLGLAVLSLVFALPKGIAVSEALTLAFLVGMLALSRRQFTRKASLLAQPFTKGWVVAVGAILGAVTGLLLFAYRDVPYGHELWWQFEFDAHAPRSLRALVAAALVATVLALRQLFGPPRREIRLPTPAEIERADTIVRGQDAAEARLALMGDKHLLFSESARAFVMYGRRGRTWVGLFDPVGAENEWPDLVWRLIENAREAGGRPAFYQVRPQTLTLYLDAGLRAFKVGEDAYVRLPDFSLSGKRRGGLRYGVNRAEREGLEFELVGQAAVPNVLAEIKAVSDVWLAQHRTAEKGFSLGAFDESYVLRQPVALLRKNDVAVAFATILSTDRKAEVSVDLMRHLPEAPSGTMDLLFAKVMLHYRDLGYERFKLGMAPLSGMAEHPLAPSWHRFGRFLFSHGEHFYNFQGLRSFKDKFDPVWEARYLASPGGVAPLLVLADVAALISGGWKGVVAK